MQLNPRETPLELEIQSLLILHGSAATAASTLIKKYESQSLTLHQIELISIFCLHAGLPAMLLELITKQIAIGSEIPWGHVAEALALSLDKLPTSLSDAVLEGAREQGMTWHLARSRAFDEADATLPKERGKRRRALQEEIQQIKRDLLLQVDMFRSQELEAEEGRTLEKLMHMFPRDPQIREQYMEYRARKALMLLEAKSSQPREPNFQDLEPAADPETAKGLGIIADAMMGIWGASDNESQLGYDFAVAHWMWENPEGSLRFLPYDTYLEPAVWMRAESLLRTRRFIELLAELVEIEKAWAANPDTTFGVAYLRAQALWGLGRKFEAIEILEGIATVNPGFRSSEALLAVWKRSVS